MSKMISVLCLLFNLLVICQSQCPDDGNVTPSLVYLPLPIGETALIKCPVRHVEFYDVTWRKRGAKDNVLASPKFSATYNNTVHYLRIENVTESDAGVYTCSVEYAVKLLPKPSSTDPAIIDITEDQEINVGDTVELNCTLLNAAGEFNLWSKDGTALTAERTFIFPRERMSVRYEYPNYTLKIENVQEEDAGKYKCIIGSYPEAVEKSVELKVNPKN
ncbi:lachesin-like [Phlebotomus argentipes]|uniref:lachesin-like n=1 Tax=Phlebotomus argentipes TaxID=94469 RepID=UPI00289351B9|nr:lachesin-like [Phlebotomus argentipes]